ncbi:transposase [Streptomyces sp. B8F3]|uniref:transposase n=1 Tax=Streptomyces sp. B8F3 TaxID=3153573 RepID=UPI00325D60D7
MHRRPTLRPIASGLTNHRCINLNTHLAAGMRRYIAAREWLSVFQLAPYAPDLNPVEGIWSVLRRATLANRAFADPDDPITTSAKDYASSNTAPTSSTTASPAQDCDPPPHDDITHSRSVAERDRSLGGSCSSRANDSALSRGSDGGPLDARARAPPCDQDFGPMLHPSHADPQITGDHCVVIADPESLGRLQLRLLPECPQLIGHHNLGHTLQIRQRPWGLRRVRSHGASL